MYTQQEMARLCFCKRGTLDYDEPTDEKDSRSQLSSGKNKLGGDFYHSLGLEKVKVITVRNTSVFAE